MERLICDLIVFFIRGVEKQIVLPMSSVKTVPWLSLSSGKWFTVAKSQEMVRVQIEVFKEDSSDRAVSLCVPPFPIEQLLVVNLACAPSSSSEVTDVCSVQKACWEMVTDLSQTPRTSKLMPKTWPNVFRHSQMADIESLLFQMCAFLYVCVYIPLSVFVCAVYRDLHVCLWIQSERSRSKENKKTTLLRISKKWRLFQLWQWNLRCFKSPVWENALA